MIYNNNIKILSTRSSRKIHKNCTLKSLVIFIVIIIQKSFNFLLLDVIFLKYIRYTCTILYMYNTTLLSDYYHILMYYDVLQNW